MRSLISGSRAPLAMSSSSSSPETPPAGHEEPFRADPLNHLSEAGDADPLVVIEGTTLAAATTAPGPVGIGGAGEQGERVVLHD
jgi:hypothetical protein